MINARRSLAALIALIAAIGLAVAGCGGGGGGSAQLTAEELREKADQICADYDKRIEELGEPNPEEFGAFLRDGSELQADMLSDLRDLTPPDELADTYNSALDTLDEITAALTSAADRIDDGEGALQVFGEMNDNLQELGSKADKAAEDLGLENCGS